MRVLFVGLGLIGGSMALALRDRAVCTGVDQNARTRQQALACGAVVEAYETLDGATVDGVDLVVLCLYPEGNLQALKTVASRLAAGTVVTDVTGIKGPICALAERVLPPSVPFIGGHPMAGREVGGFENATPTLFRGAHYLVCPAPDTPPWARERIRELIGFLGCADLMETTPENHDRQIAYTSQMMHILALAVCEQESLMPSLGFEGGSFAGATRVAALDDALWMQLFWPNRTLLAEQVGELIEKLSGYRQLLLGADEEALRLQVQAAARRKEAYNAKRDRQGGAGAVRDFD